jgi:hypothetical protein
MSSAVCAGAPSPGDPLLPVYRASGAMYAGVPARSHRAFGRTSLDSTRACPENNREKK